MKRLDKNEEKKNREEKIAKKASLGIFLSVALLFIVIICITEGIGMFYGKTAGNVAIVVIALILVAILYGKEIKAFFKRK